MCGQWIATRLLLPIERDIYQIRRIQRSFADEHATDTRIVIDNHNGGTMIYLFNFLESPYDVANRVFQQDRDFQAVLLLLS